MKDELAGKIMKEFVELRAKLHVVTQQIMVVKIKKQNTQKSAS